MQWSRTERSERDYRDAPAAVQKAFDKQARLLAQNLRHTSLRAKKYDEPNDLWQARVNQDWRFYSQIRGKSYVIVTIVRHPK